MRFRFAEFTLDTATGELSGPAGPVALRRQAWRLLEVLVTRAPALVSRDALLDAVWGHDALSPNVLPQTMSELRQALGDSPREPRLIGTLPRRGYRLLVPVLRSDAQTMPDAPGVATPPLTAVPAPVPAPGGNRHRSLALATALLGMGLALLVLLLAWPWPRPEAADSPPADGMALRLAAGAALQEGRPAQAAASLAALQQLFPGNVALALELAAVQLQANQPDAARRTLQLPLLARHASNDPQWHLLQAALAARQREPAARLRHATTAAQLAEAQGRHGMAAQAALEQARALRAQGDTAQARALLEARLSGGRAAGATAALQLELGTLLREQAEHDAAAHWLEQARATHAHAGDRAGSLSAAIELAVLQGERGAPEAAREALRVLEAEAEALGEPLLAARLANAIGTQAGALGNRDEAIDAFTAAVAAAHRAGAFELEAGAWNNTAILWMRAQRPAEAEQAWTQALQAFRALGDAAGEALALGNLAAAASSQGRAERARELNRQALQQFRALGLSRHVARTAFNLGLVAERAGALDEAQALFDEALGVLMESGEHGTALSVGARRVELHLLRGELPQAAALIQRLRAHREASDAPLPRAALDAAAAHHARLAGQLDEAQRLQSRALALRRDSGSQAWAWSSELDLARLGLMAEQPPSVIRARAEQLAERFAAEREPRDALHARLLEAQALLRAGQAAEAASVLGRARPLLDAFADAASALELRRLQLLAGGGSGLADRLHALAAEAEAGGFLLAAWRCRIEAARLAGRDALAALQRELDLRGVPGLLLE